MRLICSILIVLASLTLKSPVRASDTILEDKLNLRELPWGLKSWPINKLLTIRSPLIDAPVGSIYITRSGYAEENLASVAGNLLAAPFKIAGSLFGLGKNSDESTGARGRVVGNLWLSRQGNCALYTILQKRFFGDGSDEVANSFLNVKSLQIGAGQEIVTLDASGPPKLFTRSQFTYTKCDKGQYKDCPEYTGEEYTLRRDWQLRPADIRALSSMPSGSFKVRYVFDSHTQLEQISGGEKVSQVYSSCR
jgi:hypothetical protein